MAGGSPEAFARAEPLFAVMGKRAVHCGPAGSGQAAKICNNMLLGISMIGACEAFALAEKLGLDAGRLFDVSRPRRARAGRSTPTAPCPASAPPRLPTTTTSPASPPS
jgi:3-hydroxyisobutyrate dehydrogenase